MMRRLSIFGQAVFAALLVSGWLVAATAHSADATGDATPLDDCLGRQGLARIARVVDPTGQVVYARVLAEQDGRPTRFAAIAAASTPLAEVFERTPDADASVFEIPAAELGARVCSPVDLPQAELDAHERVSVAVGLNYAAHAEESGGGDTFLFPKPAEPTGPYAPLAPSEAVVLLDYEVELGFVLLAAIDPRDPPAGEELLAATAFFLANDVSDREPIVRHKALAGPGTGFVDGKGQPGFFPAGPWLVRGSELFEALAACKHDGLGLQLWVDEGEGYRLRQASTTAAMILDPRALLVSIGEEVERSGRLTPMPFHRDGGEHYYPLVVGEAAPELPEGSVVLTGTPEGVAIGQVDPEPLGLVLRGLAHLRGPFEQFVAEEKERARSGAPGGYLERGDRVRARIDGLGAQEFPITGPEGASPGTTACRAGAAPANASIPGGGM